MSAGKHGKEIHGFLLRNGIRMNLTVLNALRDMYVKSGFIQSAVKVLPTYTDKERSEYICSATRRTRAYRSMKSHTPLSFMLALLHTWLRKGSLTSSASRHLQLHRAWLVTLLSRSGQFDDARSFIAEERLKDMPRYSEHRSMAVGFTCN
ncbi:unnamed protein product [Malus baccata var. baccata]